MFCVPAQTTRRLGSHRFCSSNAKLHEVLENVKSQKALTSLGVSVEEVDVSKGLVRLKVPFNPDYTQQNGFMHAGIITTVLDSACGYAAFAKMPLGSNVLSIEFKVNFLSPAVGDHFVATGEVLRSGKKIVVTTGDVVAYTGETKKVVAHMQATMMCME